MSAQRQRVAPGRHVEPGIAGLHAGQRRLVPVGMARPGNAQERQLARRRLLDVLGELEGEAAERPGLVAAPAGIAVAERDVEHHAVARGIGVVDRAVVDVGAVGDHGAGRCRRIRRVVVELGIVHVVQRVPLDRDVLGPLPRDEPGRPVLAW